MVYHQIVMSVMFTNTCQQHGAWVDIIPYEQMCTQTCHHFAQLVWFTR